MSNALELALQLRPELFNSLYSLAVLPQVSKRCMHCIKEDVWRVMRTLSIEEIMNAQEEEEEELYADIDDCALLGLDCTDRSRIQLFRTKRTDSKRVFFRRTAVVLCAGLKFGDIGSVYHNMQKRKIRKQKKETIHRERFVKGTAYIRTLIPNDTLFRIFGDLLVQRYVSNGKGGLKKLQERTLRLQHLLSHLKENIPQYFDDVHVWNNVAKVWPLIEPYMSKDTSLLTELQIMQWCVNRFSGA